MPSSSFHHNPGFISHHELREGYRALFEKWRALDTKNLDFRLCGQGGEEYLSISRPVHGQKSHGAADETSSLAIENETHMYETEDEAAIHHTFSNNQNPTVEYHIIYSPTYHVPVIYFFLNNFSATGFKGIDAVYEYLVPKQRLQEIKDHGVLGAVGMTNHPVTDIPCFWVHPCNTAEAISDIRSNIGNDIGPGDYLLIWMGLVGSAVGLNLPKEMAN